MTFPPDSDRCNVADERVILVDFTDEVVDLGSTDDAAEGSRFAGLLAPDQTVVLRTHRPG